MEIWKVIDWEYFTNYEVSNYGRVKNTKTGNILKPLGKRYSSVTIRLKKYDRKNTSYLIHRLVAIAFIPNPLGLPQVNHIDGDKLNNHYGNLEWVTAYENHIHAENNGLSNYKESLVKANEVRLHKPFGQYTLDGDLIQIYNDYAEMEVVTGYTRQCISKCCNGQYKTSHGFIWRFL